MKKTDLTTGSLGQHIRRIALPVSIGFFFNTMYNVVDSFYAGQISTTALAAMALSFPVFFIIIATAEGLSKGTSVLIANAAGAKDNNLQTRLTVQGFSLGVIVSLLLTFIGLKISPSLFQLLGAEGEYLSFALAYMNPIFGGTLFFIMSSMGNASLLAHGDSKTLGNVLVAGFFLNLLLNPWFLYGGFGLPAMGIAGIAWATVVINALGAGYVFGVVLKKGYLEGIDKKCFYPDWEAYKMIFKQGLPTSFNMMTIALSFFVITYFLKQYGEEVVAAFGITARVEQIAVLPTIGIGVALMSVAGQNNGAKKFDRVRESLRLCMKYGLSLILVGSIFIYWGAEWLMKFFTEDVEVIQVGVEYIQIMAFIQWTYVVTFTCTGFLQAIKRPLYGFWESLVRKIILPCGLFFYLVHVLHHGYISLWWATVGINVGMTIITLLYVRNILQRLTDEGS